MCGKKYSWRFAYAKDSELSKKSDFKRTPQDDSQKEQLKGIWISVDASDFEPCANLLITDKIRFVDEAYGDLSSVDVPYTIQGDSLFFKEHPQLVSGENGTQAEYRGRFRVKNDTLTVTGRYNGGAFYDISGRYQRMEAHDRKIRLKYKTADNYQKAQDAAEGESGL